MRSVAPFHVDGEVRLEVGVRDRNGIRGCAIASSQTAARRSLIGGGTGARLGTGSISDMVRRHQDEEARIEWSNEERGSKQSHRRWYRGQAWHR